MTPGTPPATPRVLLYVQHLLGIGHFVRAVRLADGLAAAGFDVTLVSGGAPVPHIVPARARLVQLPPVRTADVAFSGLVGLSGQPVDDAWKQRRTAVLLDLAAQVEPHVVILEHFPFGRRQMRFELDPLIAAVRGTALIATSVRDVLVPPRADRVAEIIARVERDIDLVLVHGDAAIVPFDASFPAAAIVDRVRYTGYLGPPPPAPANRGDEILVSAGGGAVAAPLIDAAIDAYGVSANDPRVQRAASWRIRVAAATSDAGLARLQARAPGIVIERAAGDFLDRLATCRVSVSQGGYNTLVETLITGTPAVCVPFAEARETEQTTRAAAFAARGWLHHLPAADLSPQRLAAAIATAAPPPPPAAIASDGAARAAAILRAALDVTMS